MVVSLTIAIKKTKGPAFSAEPFEKMDNPSLFIC